LPIAGEHTRVLRWRPNDKAISLLQSPTRHSCQVTFDIDALVEACIAAARETDPVQAIREVVKRAVCVPEEIQPRSDQGEAPRTAARTHC